MSELGGMPQPITNMKSGQVVPSWSRDGRWINFAAGEWDPVLLRHLARSRQRRACTAADA